MCATDIGSGASWLQVHGPTEKSARGILPDRVERCAPMVQKDRDADKVKDVAAVATEDVAAAKVATEDAAEEKDEVVELRRNAKEPRSRKYQMMIQSFAVQEELEAARGPHRWTQDWQSAARTRRTSATRRTGTFDGERRCSRGCARAEASR